MKCECGCTKMTKYSIREGRCRRFVYGHYSYTEESKRMSSIIHKGNKHALGSKHSEEQNKNHSKFMIGNKNTLGYKHSEESKEKMRAKRHTEEWKKETSKRQKELWADPVYHKEIAGKIASSCGRNRPNKLETKILHLLDSHHPGRMKYSGDSSVVIGGKNPDFVSVNGDRKIIEVWGDWWHRGQNPKDRIDFFVKFGYQTLVIWEHELKDIPRLIKRVDEFMGKLLCPEN